METLAKLKVEVVKFTVPSLLLPLTLNFRVLFFLVYLLDLPLNDFV